MLDKKIQFCCTKIARGRATAARLAHNQKVAGSNPAPATRSKNPF